MPTDYSRPTQVYTVEKVTRLITVAITVVVSSCLLVWQEMIVLRPLAGEGLEMVRCHGTTQEN
jgi:hypothetical protein